ncbi:UdgX family uracil-DNA binding protein [Rhizobium sp. Root483D2]|uniref:UdgX family uracil-DNA binding protein n=1 Tax=Rhizobium sp. Root483D2 TaxID=1736545 RepID=UPI000715906B|nr:UdgX family uracil-DNA binding protein [Rhizobium sp. Root483D2]KQY36579.1 DNA polymerase [Rhizobium sp. Root483D2]
MATVLLEGRGDLTEWREAARPLLLAGTPPRGIDWRCRSDAAGDLFGADAGVADLSSPGRAIVTSGASLTVPKAFLSLAQAVICHSDPLRFQLLYRVLFRLQGERALLEVVSDADVAQLRAMEKSVRRDCHKMTAFVRFKEFDIGEGHARRRFLAWFEPDHHIVSRVAPFFQRRFTDMDWIIATPRGTAAWDGESLSVSTEPAENPMLTDSTDMLWRTYFSSIFNPARLKVKMMMTEMPKKYWKNLPEAGLIPGLIAGAEASVIAMAERAASEAPLFHQRLQAVAQAEPEIAQPPAGTLEELREEARHCTRCALHCRATQTVFGEGPQDAAVMIVGEQPGDQEDLAGRPFVGPAGAVFNKVAQDVGLDRKDTYVTNAVKHFKYEPRGKRRIHQKPNVGEVQHCKWWLTRELALVKPKLVVAMGSTALMALTDSRQRLADLRGEMLQIDAGQSLLVTVHPAYLLRIPDEGRRMEEMARFRSDIARAAEFGRKISPAGGRSSAMDDIRP